MGFSSFKSYGSKVAIPNIVGTVIVGSVIVGRYFKFQIDGVRNPNIGTVQMSELTLYKDGIRISTSGVVSSALGAIQSREEIDKAFDNNVTTKWYGNTVPNTIIFTYPSDISMNQYSYSTGNDASDRDPVSWKLFYSVDNINWILIDTKTNYPVTLDRYTTIPLISII